MCGACCALTEQLLATAEDVEDVADECDALLRRAAEADVTSAEPLQVMASLRSQQGRSEEALEAGARGGGALQSVLLLSVLCSLLLPPPDPTGGLRTSR